MTQTPKPPPAERLEAVVQVLIMLAIGAMAGAASFTHVHDVALAHGQPDWIGWADAVVVELMSIALGLELRRRARTHRPTTFVLTALVFFIAVSLAAQVVEAERSVIGWLAAALPAIGFLVLAKVVLSRTAAHAEPTPVQEPAITPTLASGTVIRPSADGSGPAPDPAADTTPAAKPVVPVEVVPEHLLHPARYAVTNHEQTTGHPITPDELATRMSVTPETARRLLTTLNPTPAAPVAVRPLAVNGTPIRGEAR